MISKTVDKEFFRYECNFCKNAWKSRPFQFKNLIDQPLKCPKCGSRYWCIKAKLNPKEEDDMEAIVKKPLALEEIQARRKAYYEAHREQRKAYSKAYNETHREQKKVYSKAYYETRREKRALAI